VGPVDVSMTVSPDRVQLGESVRVSVLVRGEANLWEVRAPFEDGFDPELAELFQRPRKLARDVGRRLALRRYFTFDIVPRRVGPLDVPEVRVAYFDPASAGYRVARARGQRVEVGERAPAAAAAPAPPGTGGEAGRAGPQRRTRPARWAWLVAGGAVLASGLVGLRRRRTRAPDVWVRVKEELALALAAEKQSEADQAAAALARALRLALSEALPDAPTLSTEEIFERTASGEPRELALLLQRLDRTRFAAAAWAEDPVDAGMALAEIRAVRLALTELREG
jgi:hypothetical protein